MISALARVCSHTVAAAAALALALSPALAHAAPSSPTDVADSVLTINDVHDGDTVSAFLIADANVDAANNLTYTMAPGLPPQYDTIEEIAPIASDGTTFTQGSAMQQAASAIAAALQTPATTATAQGTSAQLTLGSGYYLIRVTSTNGQTRVYQNMVVDVTPTPRNGGYVARDLQPVTVKKTEVSVTKTVGADNRKETDQYSVGDTVPFTVTTAVPSYPADARDAVFTIGDVMTPGLELDGSSIMINGAPAQSGTDYTLTTTLNGYTIAFTKGYVLGHPGQAVEVKYSARLTAAAFSRTSDDLTSNTATVTFNPSPYESATTGPKDTSKVKTYGYVFRKVDQGQQPLPGAVFTIRLTNGTTMTATSDANGYVAFEDLAAGSYTAVETTVPSGYQKAPDQVFELSAATATQDNPATPEAENNYLVAPQDVVDPKLPDLPITGAGGIVAMVGGGVVLVVGGILLGVLPCRKKARA